MKLSEIKNRMNEYEDFYGGDLIVFDKIRVARSKKQLCKIIESHYQFLELQNLDALAHLRKFQNELGLSLL